jgi:hypothetical protein
MVNVQLTELQAQEIAKIFKANSNTIETFAIAENRVLSNDEDLLLDCMASAFAQIEEQLEDVEEKTILQQHGDFNKQYRLNNDRLSKGN